MLWSSTEKMPLKDLKELQNRKLKAIVHHVYANSPFYRRRLKEEGINPWDFDGVKDLVKLPFTKKQDLRDTYPTGMFAVPLTKVVRYHASSGTTGKPTVVGYTENDIKYWVESLCRSFTACGVVREDTIQVAYGYGFSAVVWVFIMLQKDLERV